MSQKDSATSFFRQITQTMVNSEGVGATDEELEEPIDLDDYPDKEWWDEALSRLLGWDDLIRDAARILGANEHQLEQVMNAHQNSRVAFHQAFSAIASELDNGNLSTDRVITRMEMAFLVSICLWDDCGSSDVSKIVLSKYSVFEVTHLILVHHLRDEVHWRMVLDDKVPVEWVRASIDIESQ